MKDRIRQLRKNLGLNQTEFGERIGVKQGSIAGYESGSRTPIDAVITSICREFNVNEEWLRTGNGEMFLTPSDEIGYFVEDLLEHESTTNPFYDMIIEMMKTYHDLDEKSKTVIREYFREVKNGLNEKEED